MTRTPDLGTMFGSGAVTTFLGLPAGAPGDGAPVAIVGIPTATPYRSVGPYAAGGPAAVRAGVADDAGARAHYDFDVGGPLFPDREPVDCGDLAVGQDRAENRARITAAIGTMLDAGTVPFVLGGDDSVPIPVFAAYAGRGSYTVLQIDAHIDWRDEVDGERFGLSSTMRRTSEMAHVAGIVQLGARGLGSARPADVADAERYGAAIVPARALRREGIAAAVARVPEGAEVLVNLDLDVLDPSLVPGVIGRAPGGLTYDEVVDILAAVAARARIAGICIVEFMPERDVDGIGALNAGRIALTALSLIARQR